MDFKGDMLPDARSLSFFFLLLLALNAFAVRKGFYSTKKTFSFNRAFSFILFGFFFFYLCLIFFLNPLVFFLLEKIIRGVTCLETLGEGWKASIQLGILPFSSLLLILILKKYFPVAYSRFFPFKWDLAYLQRACVSFIFSFMWGSFIALSLQVLFTYLGFDLFYEQTAVRSLKKVAEMPTLFAFQVFVIVFFVPVTEELLFRGFLYEGLKGLLSTRAAFVLSAALFIAAHYDSAQGLGNITILAALLPLTVHLTWLKERDSHLYSAILCHMLFNMMGALQVYTHLK